MCTARHVIFETDQSAAHARRPDRGYLHPQRHSSRSRARFTKFLWFVGGNPIVFLPFVTFAVMFALWWYKGRDPDPGLSVAPMYEPPTGMTPAEAGALVDDRVDPRDITSHHGGSRGARLYQDRRDHADTTLLVFHSKDYIFHLLKPTRAVDRPGSSRAGDAGQMYSCAGDETRLSSLKNHFYTAIPAITSGHQVCAARQGHVSARPGFRQCVQHRRRDCFGSRHF